jgi:hypothetical protein
MVAPFVANFESRISAPRLDRYRPASRDPLVTITNYLWNVALSESLLQSLSAVEIGLRNTVHGVLSAREGNDYWFWGFLTGGEREFFNKEFGKQAGELRRLPTAGKIIAHQTFGFWHKIFEHKYDPIWSDNNGALLWKAFPNHPRVGVPPKDWLNRPKVQRYVHLFLDLRNRVMHHEPIYQGIERPDEAVPGQPLPVVSLWDIHDMMCELLDWIDPDLCLALTFVDRFEAVHNDEWDAILARVRGNFGIP